MSTVVVLPTTAAAVSAAIVTATFSRDFSHTRLHLALLCICDTRALDAMDQDTLMAWRR
jgi:hypothetical protein